MREPEDHYARQALLTEIEVQRRDHPQVAVYHIAAAIHAAGLTPSTSLDDLDDAQLLSIVMMGRAYMKRSLPR